MIYDTQRPYLASFVILKRGNKVAFVLRKNTGWMDGRYGLPSGKVELNEPGLVAAKRELKEEAGVNTNIENLRFVHVCHRKSADNSLWWIDLLFETDNWQGEPHNAEPEKSEELKWLDIDNLPENVVPAVRHYLEEIKAGRMYSEYGWEE